MTTANTIKIKRSGTSGAPSSLKLGELAYSYLPASGNPSTNGGDRLFIGANGVDGLGNAQDIVVIGGKYFTDLLDHQRGVLTASSALLVDADKKLDELLVDNLSLNGNTLSTTSGDLNVILSANGTGKVQINTSSNSFTLPASRTLATGYVLTANTDGTTTWAASASSLSLKAGTHTGDTGTDATIDLLTDDLEIRGDAKAITTALTKTTAGSNDHFVLEVAARLASTSQTGVASFNSNTFSVNITGEVDVKTSGISNTQLANSSFYIGTTQITLGDTSGTTTSLAVDISGNASTADSVNNALSVGTDLEFTSLDPSFDGSSAQTVNVTSTLDSVTGRGDTTTNSITVGGLTVDSGASSYSLPATDGAAGYVLTAHNDGTTTWAQASTSLTVEANSGGPRTVNLLTDTYKVVGTGALSTALSVDSANIVNTISVATATSSVLGVAKFSGSYYTVTAGDVAINDATSSSKGIASFNSTDFTVSTGAVTLNAERVEDIVGAMVSSNNESGISVTYDDTNGKLDFSVATATSSTLGLASFDTTDFTVNTGAVTLNHEAIQDIVGAMVSSNVETGISVYYDDALNHLDFQVTVATTTTKGIANFVASTFSVTSGEVDVKTGGISNTQLANSKVTIGTTDISLGASSTTLAGLTQVDVGNLKLSANTIEATDTNGSVTLTPKGTGTVDVSSKRITSVATPINPTDAANRAYVDNAVSGLTWKDAVNLLATMNVPLTGTITSITALNIDGHGALHDGYRLLLTGQTTTANNGIYEYYESGSNYALTRTSDADAYTELIGVSVFVMEGTTYASTGWVQSNHYITDFDNQHWVQFSGAGAFTAGDGLGQTGTTFFVKTAANGGLEVSADYLQLKSSVAGTALDYTTGVIDVKYDDTSITVNGSDQLSIKSTWAGQAAITTVGTITTGTWNANTLTYAYGGTGQTTYAKGDILYASAANTLSKLTAGTNGQVLQLQDGVPEWADLDGGTY